MQPGILPFIRICIHCGTGKGFETHGHVNMEIITYVMSGALQVLLSSSSWFQTEETSQHKDSLGNGSVIKPGEVLSLAKKSTLFEFFIQWNLQIQRMSAGKGITHSEFNPSSTELTHLLQIWIMPDRTGYPPSYEQKPYDESEKIGSLKLLASPNGEKQSVSIHQDVKMFASNLRLLNNSQYCKLTLTLFTKTFW